MATTPTQTADKTRQNYQVPFHVKNSKALELIANNYGVNSKDIGKPISVPQFLKELALNYIEALEHKLQFDVTHEAELSTRNRTPLPAWALALPEDAQERLRQMNKADRDAAGAVFMAEAMRHMAATNASVLSEMAKHMAAADGRAEREADAAKLESAKR